MARDPHAVEEILEFWFGALDDRGQASADCAKRWWKKDAAFDELVRRRFLEDHRAISAKKREVWLEQPRGRLAAILVLDQFSRNMFRGTPEMFASDAQALAIATDGLAQGADTTLGTDERSFFYMPLMHSEDLTVQDSSVGLWTAFRDSVATGVRSRIAANRKHAVQHRDIIAKFGRFPHRNKILGRPSTGEERLFLSGPGSSF